MTGTMLLVVGLGAVFLSIVLVLATVGALSAERTGVSRSLAAVEAMSAAPESMRDELDRPFGDRVVSPFMTRLIGWGRRATPTGQADRIRRRLDLAGNPVGWDVDRVLAYKMIGVIAGAILGFAVPLLMGWSLGVLAIVLVGLAVLGFMLPNLVLYQVSYERTERMRKDLPDALDLLTISVESGLSFDAALAQVARNTPGPLAGEFFRVLQEMQLGVGRSDAIRAMGERTDLPDLRQFATAMVQADSFGIPIANVLRVQSKEMRVKRSQRAEELAQKVPVKILFPLIFCILPVLFVVVLGPAAINIIESLISAW